MKTKLPKYSDKRGWYGGDEYALYCFEDNRTGRIKVSPVYCAGGIGPEVSVRVATREEAEKYWQNPLNPSWKVTEGACECCGGELPQGQTRGVCHACSAAGCGPAGADGNWSRGRECPLRDLL